MGRRSGFTLVETLIAVIIVSVMSLMAYPRVNRAMIKSDLRGGKTRLVNMASTARAAAAAGGRSVSYLKFNGNTAFVTASPRRAAGNGTEDTLGAVVNVSTTYNATLATNGIAMITYDPRGMASGFTGGTWIKLSHGSYSDSLRIDQLGRVTK